MIADIKRPPIHLQRIKLNGEFRAQARIHVRHGRTTAISKALALVQLSDDSRVVFVGRFGKPEAVHDVQQAESVKVATGHPVEYHRRPFPPIDKPWQAPTAGEPATQVN